ncbi:hypothetical protein M9Y10_024672 [Tritrichomonas musculus]|uniref:Ankyrin repeat protein n=1 Tax=Tritrichomonas musculus TaxID=1915356 RepID=A0ABR2HAX0_9EUKA
MNKKLFYIINNVNDCNNKSFLYYSSSNLNGQRVLEILINPQFNLKKSDILSSFIVFYSSNSPRKHDDDILKALLISIMKELYNYDIEPDYLISIYFSDKDVVNFLIEKRANLNQPDKYGVYPLQKAINISSKENISALVKTKDLFPKN